LNWALLRGLGLAFVAVAGAGASIFFAW